MPSHKPAERLVARYLNPAKRWDAGSEAALRDLIRDDMDARATYREAVTAHRLMVGCDPQFPSGFEARRMRDAVVEQAGAQAVTHRSPMTRRFAMWGGLVGFGAACAAAALLVTIQPVGDLVQGGVEAPLTDLRTRGGQSVTADLGLGLSGVSRSNPIDEYEIVAGGGVPLGDFLRVYITNERPALSHLFVFVLQAGRAPIWYAPMPPDATQSLAAPQGRTVMLDAEYAVDADRYAPGPARAVAIFSAAPITVAALTPHLDEALGRLAPSAAAAELGRRLGLSAPDEVVIVGFDVSPAQAIGSGGAR